MKRLEIPDIQFTEVVDKIVEGITGDDAFAEKVMQEKRGLLTANESYNAGGRTAELYTIPAVRGTGNLPVIGVLSKDDLVKLYKNYFAKKAKPARAIYNQLMVAAKDECAFCGGIGRPRNLDHYLPKASFPQYSVIPVNLVPSCRDCNMDGKGEVYATAAQEQVLHPYLDHSRFYDEQWIEATCSFDHAGLGVTEYNVSPPFHWTDEDKLRVQNHFEAFDIGRVYSREAASRMTIYAQQIRQLLELGIGEGDAKNAILAPAIENAPFINHWERVMCIALRGYSFLAE